MVHRNKGRTFGLVHNAGRPNIRANTPVYRASCIAALLSIAEAELLRVVHMFPLSPQFAALLRRPVCRGNGLMKEIEAQIEGLRTSPRARRALEARVWNHLSKRSKPYGHGRRIPLDDASVYTNDSVESVGSVGSVETGRAEGQPDDWQERVTDSSVQRRDNGPTHLGGESTSRKTAEQAGVSERVAAQAMHAQEVLRRRRCVHVNIFSCCMEQ